MHPRADLISLLAPPSLSFLDLNFHFDFHYPNPVVGGVLNPYTNSMSIRVSYHSRKVVNGCEFRPSALVKQSEVEAGVDNMRTIYTLWEQVVVST